MSKIPNSPEDTKAIRQALDQISEEMTTIQTSKTQINEILKALEDKYKVPKKTLRKVSNLYFKQNVLEFENETSEVKELYGAISGVYKTPTT
jgi:ribosome maturation protein Sdo1